MSMTIYSTTDILMENIMIIMSTEYFSRDRSAHIVGGLKKLERLIEAGEIEMTKPVNSQNAKWYCRADQVLRHCRNMRPKKGNSKRTKK